MGNNKDIIFDEKSEGFMGRIGLKRADITVGDEEPFEIYTQRGLHTVLARAAFYNQISLAVVSSFYDKFKARLVPDMAAIAAAVRAVKIEGSFEGYAFELCAKTRSHGHFRFGEGWLCKRVGEQIYSFEYGLYKLRNALPAKTDPANIEAAVALLKKLLDADMPIDAQRGDRILDLVMGIKSQHL